MIDKLLTASPTWLLILIICGAMTFGFAIGTAFGDAKVNALKAKQATTERDAAKSAIERLVAAQSRADAIETRLHAAEAQRLTQSQEHQREIKRITTGRPCLNRGTVRLLNRAPVIPAAVPETASQPVAEDAAAATDTDVAEWIDHAIDQYDTCRDHLGALIDFEQGDPQ